MYVVISAKSAVSSPRTLIINNNPIYELDRNDGYRLTVINRNTLQVVFDRNFTNAQDLANYLQEYSNNPKFIVIVVGHGKNMVYIKIQDNFTGHVVKKYGTNIIYAKYIFYRNENDNTEQQSTTQQNQAPQKVEASIFGGKGFTMLLPLLAFGALIFTEKENEYD